MKLSKMQDERAQGVVEFALIATILMLIFLGVVDYARFMYYDTAVRNAARAGAEIGTTGCTNRANCGTIGAASTDDFAVQAAVCESKDFVSLQPFPTAANFDFCSYCNSGGCSTGYPCVPPGTTTDLCTSAVRATGGGVRNCTQDVCVERILSGSTDSSQTPTDGETFKVSVGYGFEPISPLMRGFFQAKDCFGEGTSVGHTLCATSYGRVF